MSDIMLSAGADPDLGGDSIQFVGNATTLIRYAGFTLLTDPNFVRRGERVALGYGLRSRRLKEPALTIDELPHSTRSASGASRTVARSPRAAATRRRRSRAR